MTKSFKKLCFWPIFGPFSQFWGGNIFLENPALSSTTFQHQAKIQRKTNDTIPRKHPDRRMNGRVDGRVDGKVDGRTDGRKDERTDGRTDGRTNRPYFVGPFRLPPGVQKNLKCLEHNFMKYCHQQKNNSQFL